ncbi:MAG: hypothetical protein QOJ16_1948 [Acidobacteriota bacterium]|nr:hypothetical protein [Acidobacteriota bacterium]
MRTRNPAFRDTAFTGLATSAEAMTVRGTVHKTAALAILVLTSAIWSWSQVRAGSPATPAIMGIGLIGGLAMAVVTIFKRSWAGVTSPVYALLEGLVLGALSALFESSYHGIVAPAVGLTFGTLFAMLALYSTGLVRATQKFKIMVMSATGGVCLLYIASMVLGLFGHRIPFIHESGPLGIGFSAVVVVIAAMNLVIDFDFIETAAAQGAPKYMEWYGAFALLVTLIWLYMEVLRLLSKLRRR